MKKIFILISILLITSCSGSGKQVGVLYKEIKTNQTQIFVKRETGFAGSAALIKVGLNGISIGELGNNERLSAPTKVGSGILSAGYTLIASVGSNDASRSFQIKKGQKLFFVIKQDIGLMSTKLRIYPIDRNDFFSN
ncbi:MAG: hypothetical protein CMM75_09540 [Rhodospirillaceae bacterium]|nr:hypothetical protein [Rhodospirillaceae bacterium]|tara:strand:+ start:673 stop:1083 length:411 start_codon:yes stop_codon:yes gene_type:complete